MPSWTTGRMAAVGAALALAAAACGGGGGQQASDPASATPETGRDPTAAASPAESVSPAASASGTAPGATAQSETSAPPAILDFEAQTVSGEPIDGAEYAGRDVAIWFWAPW